MKARSFVVVGGTLSSSDLVYAKKCARAQERIGQQSAVHSLPSKGGKDFIKITIYDDLIKILVQSSGGEPPANYYFSGGSLDTESKMFNAKAYPDKSNESNTIALVRDTDGFNKPTVTQKVTDHNQDVLFYEEQSSGFALNTEPALIGKLARFNWNKGAISVLGGAGKRNTVPTFSVQQANCVYGFPEHPHPGFVELPPTLIKRDTCETVYQGVAGSECVSAIYIKSHIIGITGHNEFRYWHKNTPDIILTSTFEIPEGYNNLDWVRTQWFFNKKGTKAVGCLYKTIQELGGFGDIVTSMRPSICVLKISAGTNDKGQFEVSAEVLLQTQQFSVLSVDWYEGLIPEQAPLFESEEYSYFVAGGGDPEINDPKEPISYVCEGVSSFTSDVPCPSPQITSSYKFTLYNQEAKADGTVPSYKHIYPSSAEYIHALNEDAIGKRIYREIENEDWFDAPYCTICDLEDSNSDKEYCIYESHSIGKYPQVYDFTDPVRSVPYIENPRGIGFHGILYTSLTSDSYYSYPYLVLGAMEIENAPYYNTSSNDPNAWERYRDLDDWRYAIQTRIQPHSFSLDLRTHSVVGSFALTNKHTTELGDEDIEIEITPMSVTSQEGTSPQSAGHIGCSFYSILPDHPESVYTSDEQERVKSLHVEDRVYSDNATDYSKSIVDEMLGIENKEGADLRLAFSGRGTQNFNTSLNVAVAHSHITAKVHEDKLSYAVEALIPHGVNSTSVKSNRCGCDSVNLTDCYNFLPSVYGEETDMFSYNLFTVLDTYANVWDPSNFTLGSKFFPAYKVNDYFRKNSRYTTFPDHNYQGAPILPIEDISVFKTLSKLVIEGKEEVLLDSGAETISQGLGFASLDSTFNSLDKNKTITCLSYRYSGERSDYWLGAHAIMYHLRIRSEAGIFI